MTVAARSSRSGRRGAAVVLFRVVATVHAAAAVTQPVLAGQYLSGQFSALKTHQAVGGVLLLIALVMVCAAVLLRWPGRGSVWGLPTALLLFVAEIVQTSSGTSRNLGLHIPLGVAIVTASVAVAWWSWTSRPAGKRG